jgi:hypothetical protein
LLALVATSERLTPDLALRFDRDGQVVGKVLLPVHEEPEDDGLDDLGEESPPPPAAPVVLALGDGARPSKPCKCVDPFEWNEPGVCARCGHRLAGGRVPTGTRV